MKKITHHLKKVKVHRWAIFAVAVLLLSFYLSLSFRTPTRAANSCTSAAGGDWNTASTWTNCGGGVPQADDDVTISHSVTIGSYVMNQVNNITVANSGTLTQNNTSTQTISGTLTIQNGGTLTHGANGASLTKQVNFVANNITVDLGGSINTDAKGWQGARGPGKGGDSFSYAGGGGHCGAGGSVGGGGTAGTQNDDVSNITGAGSGGGTGLPVTSGGYGGGLIYLNVVGTLSVSGSITANGNVGTGNSSSLGSGGGAGGGIKIVANSISGTPSAFKAIGGNGGLGAYYAGGGGGGCIYLEYTTSNSISTSSDYYSIAGGTDGGVAGSSMFVGGSPPAGPPTAPTNITTSTVTTSSITVGWTDNSSDETGFVVDQSTNGTTFTNVTTTGAGVTSTTVSSLLPNTRYWFRVAATSTNGISSYVTTTAGTYASSTIPGTPTVSNVNTSSLTLAWADNSNSTSTVYYILYSTGSSATTTATTTNITGLTPNTSYQFQVRAENLGLAGTYSDYSSSSTATTTLNTIPTAPTSITTSTISSTSITIGWTDNSSNETGFSVDQSTNGTSFTNVSTTAADATSISISSLAPNTAYWFRVAAINAVGTSTYTTTTQSTYTSSSIPGTPTVSNLSTSSLTLTWDGNSNGSGTVFFILYSNGSSSTTTATTANITGLTPNTSYQFQVRAENLGLAGTYSSYSASSTATTTQNVIPTAPTSITTSTVAATSITVGWTDNSNNETGFVVDKSTNGTDWTNFTTTAADETSVSVTSLTPNTTHWFRVAATNAVGTSSYVTTSVSTYTKAADPTSLATTASTTNSISLSFNANSNPDGTEYYITGTNGFTPITTTTLTPTLTSLTLNTSYTFTVKSVNNDGSYNNAVNVTDYTKATAPGTPTASSVSTSSLSLSWADNSNPSTTVYYILYSSGSTATTTATTTSITGLSPNTLYQFQVRAEHLGSLGSYTSYSASSTATTTLNVAPSAPTGITTSTISATGMTVGWTDNSSNETGFIVDQSTDGTSFSNVTTTAENAVSVSVASLSPNTRYWFRVAATNAIGDSSYVTTSVSTYTNSTPPGTPTVTNVNTSSLTLNWADNSNPSPSTTYYILYSNGSTATTTATTTSITGLDQNTSYQFQVRAENLGASGTYSAYSASSTATTTLEAPAVPASTPVAGGSGVTGAQLAPPAPIAAAGQTTPPPLSIIINNNAENTASTLVDLVLNGGNAKRMAISNSPDFSGTGQETYYPNKKWDLCFALSSCLEGTHKVYIKFYSEYGVATEVLNDAINYQKPAPAIQPVQPIAEPEESETAPEPTIQSAEEIRQENPELVQELEKTETPLPLKVPDMITLPLEPIKELLSIPYSEEMANLVEKFPTLQQTFEKVGVSTMSDLGKLENIKLVLPSLGSIAELGMVGPGANINLGSALSLSAPKLLSQFSVQEKQNIPSDVIFAKVGGEKIDLSIKLTVDENRELRQTIRTMANRGLLLIVKPESKAKRIRGYLVMKDIKKETSWFKSLITPARAQETEFVLAEFDYTDPDADGIYTAKIKTPAVEGEYEVITLIDFEDKKLPQRQLRLVTVIDPEGYVFRKDGEDEVRVKNAVVSIFRLNSAKNQYELWPADQFNQENPQTTDKTGKYAFLVPEGTYYLQVEAKNYATYVGQPFQVKEGVGVHENIEMKKKYWWVGVVDWKTLIIGLLAGALLGAIFYIRKKPRL